MASADVQQLLMIYDAERRKYGVVICKRFALPHHDDVGHPFSEILLNGQNLIDDFSNAKVSR